MPDKCVSLSVCGFVGMTVPTEAKGIKSPLELEIQLAISRPTRVLEIILRFSARAVHTLTHGVSSPALTWRFKGTHSFSGPWGFPQCSVLYSKLATRKQCVFPERNPGRRQGSWVDEKYNSSYLLAIRLSLLPSLTIARAHAPLSIHLEVQPVLVPLKGCPRDGGGFAKAANTWSRWQYLCWCLWLPRSVAKVADDVADNQVCVLGISVTVSIRTSSRLLFFSGQSA